MDTISGIGVDLVDVARVSRWLRRHDRNTLLTIFSELELAEADLHTASAFRLAASFAIKEAVGKAFGTGLAGLNWCDITLRTAPALSIELERTAARAAEERQIVRWLLEVREHAEFVAARVIALRATNASDEKRLGLTPASLIQSANTLAVAPAERAFARYGARWLERVLAPLELSYVLNHPSPPAAAAARVAARRAVRAALGAPNGLAWPRPDAAIRSEVGQPPRLLLKGAPRALADHAGLSLAGLSLAHAAGHAAAFVVFERAHGPAADEPLAQ